MTTLEPAWQELLTAALLGTGRRPPALPALDGALGALLARLDPADAQHFLLRAGAALALYRQVGRLPERAPAGGMPACPSDEQPRCSAAAASRLSALLGGAYPELIPEWLELAGAARQRAPEELLPELLAWGENHVDLADRLLPVLGMRGRWLAERMPGCEKVAAAVFAETVTAATAEAAWQTGRKAVRRLLLRRLRASDPAQAFGLLVATWSEESTEERAAFLETFSAGLSQTDEAFLEAALDDRARGVRSAAAALLAHLPGSRLVQRQVERAQAFIKWKPGGFLRKPQIEVVLPEACDKDMLRDGIEPKRPVRSRHGEKSDWLLQILSAVPPSTWSSQWGKSPSELLEIAGDGDWEELLHESWITATLRHADPDWAEALLKVYPGRSRLLGALPANRRVAYLAAQLQSKPREGLELLEGYHFPWGAELTRLALPHLRKYFIGENDPPLLPALRTSLLALGLYIDPTLTHEVDQFLVEKAEPGSTWEKAVESLLQILDFRRAMMEEFK